MNKLEPTYLRYVIDNLVKGTISAENAAALPIGFIEVYEKELMQFERLREREILFDHLLVWALLKESVSTSLVARILMVEEGSVKSMIDQLSSWFNSTGNGKYQLYHERIRIFILTKVNDSKIQHITESIRFFCEQVLLEIDKFEKEYIDFTLKYYTDYLVDLSYFNPEYYKSLLEYCFSSEVRNTHLKWFKSIRYINKSYDDTIKRAIEIDENEDIFKLLNEKLKNKYSVILQLKYSYKKDLIEFTKGFLSSGLTQDEIYFKQYFLLTLFKLLKLIRSGSIQQSDVEIVFKSINKSDYEDYFEDISSIASKQFFSELILKLQEIDIDCSCIFEHLPVDFDINVQITHYQPAKYLSSSYIDIEDSDIRSFIINKWESEIMPHSNTDFFSAIDDPIYFQDKLIELYEYSAENDDMDTVINALGCTKSKIHFSEILALLTINLNRLVDANEEILAENVLVSYFELSYFKVVERLKNIVDNYLRINDFKKLTKLLFSLDRNSFEYYVEYSFNFFCDCGSFKNASKVIDILMRYLKNHSLSNDSHTLNNLVNKYNKSVQLQSDYKILYGNNHDTLNNSDKCVILETLKSYSIIDVLDAFRTSSFLLLFEREYGENLLRYIESILIRDKDELREDYTRKFDSIFYKQVVSAVDLDCAFIFSDKVGVYMDDISRCNDQISIFIDNVQNRWNSSEKIDSSDYINYKRIQLSILNNFSEDIINLKNSAELINVDDIVESQIAALEESVPSEHYEDILNELVELLRFKIETAIQIREIRQDQLKLYFADLLERLHFKLVSDEDKFDLIRLLMIASEFNDRDIVREYLRISLEISKVDKVVIGYFTSVPSLATLVELLGKFDFKGDLNRFLISGIFPQYNYLIFKEYFGVNIHNSIIYLNKMTLLSEDSRAEAYYNLGLNISDTCIRKEVINSLDQLYIKDFMRGFLQKIYSGNRDTLKYLKFLYYHTSTFPYIYDAILSELLVYMSFYRSSGLHRYDMLNRQIENMYTKKIYAYAK